jgi:lipoate-protein ligase A
MPELQPIRLLDLGLVPPVRSQTIYHAVGYCLTAHSPDTIILVSPERPYVSVGRHQDAGREVDLARCEELGLPVVRREVGGGAVYLDANQLFTQWAFAAHNLPPTVQGRYELYSDTLVRTYQRLGIAAEYRPVNDIHVTGRKIGGTGAARMDLAEVLVGSLMFDFDTATMATVLRVPSEKLRDKVRQSLQDYMTTMRKELGTPPSRGTVVAAYVAATEEILGRRLVPGVLRPEELARAAELDLRFASREWLEDGGGFHQMGIKIHEGVRVLEGAYKAPGGLIRALVRLRDGRIDDLALSGDFTALPASVPDDLSQTLIGCLPEREALLAAVNSFLERARPEVPGVTAADWGSAILAATGTDEAAGSRPTGGQA